MKKYLLLALLAAAGSAQAQWTVTGRAIEGESHFTNHRLEFVATQTHFVPKGKTSDGKDTEANAFTIEMGCPGRGFEINIKSANGGFPQKNDVRMSFGNGVWVTHTALVNETRDTIRLASDDLLRHYQAGGHLRHMHLVFKANGEEHRVRLDNINGPVAYKHVTNSWECERPNLWYMDTEWREGKYNDARHRY